MKKQRKRKGVWFAVAAVTSCVLCLLSGIFFLLKKTAYPSSVVLENVITYPMVFTTVPLPKQLMFSGSEQLLKKMSR